MKGTIDDHQEAGLRDRCSHGGGGQIDEEVRKYTGADRPMPYAVT